MGKILVIDDDDIVKKFLSEIAEENIVVIDKKDKNKILIYGDIQLNQETYEVLKNDKKVFLTVREFEILKLFMENPNKVFTRNNLLNSIWNYDYMGDEKIVNTHIKNIRKKLGKDIIKTVRGAGYKL